MQSISVVNGLCLHLFIFKYWQSKNFPFALTAFLIIFYIKQNGINWLKTIKSLLLYLYPNFPIAVIVNLKLVIQLLYIFIVLLRSFIWHMFLITGKTPASLRRKIVLKQNLMKSLINLRGPDVMRWLVTCRAGPGPGGRTGLDIEICLQIICLISDEH